MDSFEARKKLLERVKQGDTIYTLVSWYSKTGMGRTIRLFHAQILTYDETPKPIIAELTYLVSQLLGKKPIHGKHDGIYMPGYGMDMGFELVYRMGETLWPEAERPGYLLHKETL